MTRLVVALRAEARPLIHRYSMERLEPSSDGAFPTYQGDSKTLVICGVGKAAAADATAHPVEDASGVWLNVGVAGHRDRHAGELVRANRITDAATGKRFYPTLLGLPDVDTAGVTTVDVAEKTFTTNDLFEMEASGFYETALGFSTAELVQCVKIVSDNRESGTGGLTAARVSGLIEQNLDIIDAIVAHLESLDAALAPARMPIDVIPFLGTWRFTTSERRRLGRLIERLEAFRAPPDMDELRGLDSASAVLSALDARLRVLATAQSEF